MMSLRLDKFFGSWAREFSPDYTPGETGLDRFIRWNKQADWIGKAAAMAEKAEGPKRELVSFVVDAEDADVVAYEPIWLDDTVVGFCTSGGFAIPPANRSRWASCRSIMVEDGLACEIEILGERRPARVHLAPLWDDEAACAANLRVILSPQISSGGEVPCTEGGRRPPSCPAQSTHWP